MGMPERPEWGSCCHQFHSILVEMRAANPGLVYGSPKFCMWCGKPFDETLEPLEREGG